MTAYADGRRFEWKTRNVLTTDGYEVSRSAGSKKKIDLFAMKPGQLLYVQCKRDGVCGPAEWDRLFELASWIDEAVPVLAVNGPKGRGVVLWRLCGPKRRGLGWDRQPVHRFHTDEAFELKSE